MAAIDQVTEALPVSRMDIHRVPRAGTAEVRQLAATAEAIPAAVHRAGVPRADLAAEPRRAADTVAAITAEALEEDRPPAAVIPRQATETTKSFSGISSGDLNHSSPKEAQKRASFFFSAYCQMAEKCKQVRGLGNHEARINYFGDLAESAFCVTTMFSR